MKATEEQLKKVQEIEDFIIKQKQKIDKIRKRLNKKKQIKWALFLLADYSRFAGLPKWSLSGLLPLLKGD